MASQLVLEYESDTSEYVEIDNEYSTTCCSSVGSTESNSHSITSRPSSIQFYQCTDCNEEPLLECPTCGSFYELGSHCPRMCEHNIE
jgi:hypothetical protein